MSIHINRSFAKSKYYFLMETCIIITGKKKLPSPSLFQPPTPLTKKSFHLTAKTEHKYWIFGFALCLTSHNPPPPYTHKIYGGTIH